MPHHLVPLPGTAAVDGDAEPTPRQAAAAWWSDLLGRHVGSADVEWLYPEYGWCLTDLDGTVCLRAKDHTGDHRGFVFMDDARRRWDVLDDADLPEGVVAESGSGSPFLPTEG